MQTRNEVTKQIKQALKKRTGLTWSVTGGRGTGWGWLKIEAPKARRVMHDSNPAYTFELSHEQDDLPWIERQPEEDETAYNTSQEDREILAEALGIGMNQSSAQGVLISPDSWNFFIERAENGKPEPEPVEEVEEFVFIETPEAPEDIQTEAVEDDEMVEVKVPKLNKNSHIDQYLPQLDNENDYNIEKAKITDIAYLTQSQYDALINGNLLTDFDWLAGKGGCDSTADLREVNKIWEYTDEEMDEWRKHAYILVIKVVAPGRPVIYVDPQGHNYARYVAFPIQQEIWTEGKSENPIVEMIKVFLQDKSPVDVLNILIGSGIESKQAVMMMAEALQVI